MAARRKRAVAGIARQEAYRCMAVNENRHLFFSAGERVLSVTAHLAGVVLTAALR